MPDNKSGTNRIPRKLKKAAKKSVITKIGGNIWHSSEVKILSVGPSFSETRTRAWIAKGEPHVGGKLVLAYQLSPK